jgi:glycosyltransferase involved in cell wall biosynthesis
MNITCVIHSMCGGGAERVMTHLAGGLARRGHRVTLTTMDPSIPDFYPVPEGVARTSPEGGAGTCRWYQLHRQITRLRALRRRVSGQHPDVVISFMDATNILLLAAFRSGKPPVIACEHINPLYYRIGPHWELLRRLLYPSAARVVMLTEDTLAWARSLTPAWNAVAIANPVLAPVFSDNSARPAYLGAQKNLMAMGRLHPQKGFDILLSAFAGIAGKFPHWQLTILGEGPERGRLEALRDRLGLTGRVSLPGASTAPCDILKHADLFVMPSRFEGFGMALAEAMACGLPAVSFDCPSGPGVILRHGVDGLLVAPEDERGLAAALEELMSDEEKRKSMAARAAEVVGRFSVEKYLDVWEKLLGETAGTGNSGLPGRAG